MSTDLRFGDKVKLTYKGKKIDGIFISLEDGLVTLKLGSGYNIVLQEDEFHIEEVIRAEKKPERKPKSIDVKNGVKILATGGTIASRIDYTTGAVKPSPEVISTLETGDQNVGYSVIDDILSENMTPEKWIYIAQKTKEELDRGNHVVILHGTDTMTYTASALAFMMEKQSRSIILTGSQRSSDRPSSDAFENISSSILFTSLNIGEVCISMHGSISDFSGRLMRGTRSRKMHTSRRDAIRPVDEKYLARIEDGIAIPEAPFRATDENSILLPKLDRKVALLYFYPGMDPSIFETLAQKNNAIVLMGTGLGHVSEGIISEVRKAHRSGVHTVVTSQCIAGNTNLNVYSTGRELKAAGAISAGDILPEVALTKAMFLLANYRDEFEERMRKPMRREIEERLESE